MTSDDPTTRYLKEIVLPVVEGAYISTVRVVDHIDSLESEAATSLTSYEYFVRDYARLLVAVEQLVADNEEMKAELAAHVILTKLINALTLIKNVKAMQEVDQVMIAAVLENVRSTGIMFDSLMLLTEKALQRLKDALSELDDNQEKDTNTQEV